MIYHRRSIQEPCYITIQPQPITLRVPRFAWEWLAGRGLRQQLRERDRVLFANQTKAVKHPRP